MLRALVLLDNPCSDEPDYRLEVLVLLPHLQRLDKELFEQDERAEAKKIRQKREKEEEVRTAWQGEEKEAKGKREDPTWRSSLSSSRLQEGKAEGGQSQGQRSRHQRLGFTAGL